MPGTPNAIDLITLSDAKAWISTAMPGATVDDLVIQSCITGVSQYVITQTGRLCLSDIKSFTDRYDGNGNDLLLLRQYPIVTIQSLTVGTQTIAQSPDYVQTGWAINSTKTGIVLLGGCSRFCKGRMNVGISWTAGYNGAPYDLQQAVMEIVAQDYARRSTVDSASIIIPQGGTTTFRAWAIPPKAQSVILSYKRPWP